MPILIIFLALLAIALPPETQPVSTGSGREVSKIPKSATPELIPEPMSSAVAAPQAIATPPAMEHAATGFGAVFSSLPPPEMATAVAQDTSSGHAIEQEVRSEKSDKFDRKPAGTKGFIAPEEKRLGSTKLGPDSDVAAASSVGAAHRARPAWGSVLYESLPDLLQETSARFPTAVIEAPDSKADPYAVWNVWASLANDQRYALQPKLAPATEYRVSLDLAAFSYGDPKGGVVTVQPGKPFKDALLKWLNDTRRSEVNLRAVLLPDTSFFDEQTPQVVPIRIDLTRLRGLNRGRAAPGGDLFEQLSKGLLQESVFSSAVDFAVRTRAKLPDGTASIAISIWDGRRPIDEIVVGFCTNEHECKGAQGVQSGFRGMDSVRLATEDAASRPDAAIHFIQMSPGGAVLGVLWWGQMERPVVWEVQSNAQALTNRIVNLMHSLSPAKETGDRASEGHALFNLFFPDAEGGKEARGSFMQLLREHGMGTKEPFPSDRLPALFVRVSFIDLTAVRFFPLGMMATEVDGGKTRFVGEYFRLETPLLRQAYMPTKGCLAEWKILAPRGTEDEPLRLAYEQIRSRITNVDANTRTVKIGVHQFPLDYNVQNFLKWVDQDKTEETAILLSLLSHYDRDSIYLDARVRARSEHIRRTFAQSSVALLNGCGTGDAGATGFLDALNDRGIEAAVVTVSEIPGSMAGKFLECFASGIEKTDKRSTITLAEAYTRALKCVSKDYGAKALWYSLLGNSGLALCGAGDIK